MTDLGNILNGSISAVLLNIFADILSKLLEPFNEICDRILDEYGTAVSVREQELFGIPHSRLVGTCLLPFQEQREIRERINSENRGLRSDAQRWGNALLTFKLVIGGFTVVILLVAAVCVLLDLGEDPYTIKVVGSPVFVRGLVVIIIIAIAFGVCVFLLRAIDYENRYRKLRGLIEETIFWPRHIPYLSGVSLREPLAVRIVRLSTRGFCKVVRWIKNEFTLPRDTLSDLPPSQ